MINMSFKDFLAEVEVTAGLPVDQRLQAGWAAEDFVIAVLERMIGPVQKSNSYEDKTSKQDAFIDGRKFGLGTITAQIKARESGDDIIVEWYNDYPRGEGRDKIGLSRGQTQLYVTMDSNRERIYLISAKEVEKECNRLFHLWEKNGKQQTYRDAAGEVKSLASRDVWGAKKIMIFLKTAPLRGKSGLPGLPTALKVPDDMKAGSSPIKLPGSTIKTLPEPSPSKPTPTTPQTIDPPKVDFAQGQPTKRA
jgi:hypothetical protein